jgi:hypothetical protein
VSGRISNTPAAQLRRHYAPQIPIMHDYIDFTQEHLELVEEIIEDIQRKYPYTIYNTVQRIILPQILGS